MKWIRANAPIKENEYHEFLAFFEWDGEKTVLDISSETDYCAYVNGKTAGYGQYEDLEDLKVYDSLDITRLLKKGKNVLGIVAFFEHTETSHYTEKGYGLAFKVKRGNKVVAESGRHTLSRVSRAYESGPHIPLITVQLGKSYIYDFTKEDDWLLGNETGSFAPSTVIDRDVNLLPRPISKLTETLNAATVIRIGSYEYVSNYETAAQRMYYAKLSETVTDVSLPQKDGYRIESEKTVYLLVDMKDEKTGILSFDVEVDKPCYMAVGYGEHIVDNRIRTSIGSRNFQFEFRLKKGRNRFTGPFRRLGMRYMCMFLDNPSAVVYDFNLISTDYPVVEKKVKIEDKRLAEIYSTAVKTLKVCMHEHYEDTPWREQALYSMDSRNQMLCGYYAFEGFEFQNAALRLMSHNIRIDNVFSLTSPRTRVPGAGDANIPCFSLVQFCAADDYMKFSGDTGIIRDYESNYRRVLDKFISLQDKNGLIKPLTGIDYWNFYEWTDELDDNDFFVGRTVPNRYDAPLNAFFIMAIKSMINMLTAIKSYDGEYDEVLRSAQESIELFFDDNKACYADFLDSDGTLRHYSELTNSLCALVSENEVHKAAAVKCLLNGNLPMKITLSHSIFKYEALMNCGKLAEDFIINEIKTIWGNMLNSGASTFYEDARGDAAFDNAGSLSHGWSAVPVYVLHKLKFCK